MSSYFNEDSRVKIPSILHLIQLGYEYLSLKDNTWDKGTNIFTTIFNQQIKAINPELSHTEIQKVYDDITLSLDNEDLGRAFYNKLIDQSGIRLIDLENFENNSFHVVTELTYQKDEESFRPDIILLINGMPLIFIEVKKPNNQEGILAEHNRMKKRFQNKKFRKFINLTQLMVFSNNMEYNEQDTQMLEGAFYSTTNYFKPMFNYFREEETFDLDKLLKPITEEEEEIFVLKDNNYLSIKNAPEYISNKNPNKATNRIITSLLQKERLQFILKYAFAYVEEENGLEKHVMRYPQLFATKAIEQKLENGIKKGIIWHTQGSGKTALAFFNVKHLTHYYQKKGIIPKFYFIVDRLDLLTQAAKEFTARGLIVHKIDSREEFSKDIKSTQVIHNNSGKSEITVVNIHKFKDDPDVIKNNDYNLSIQRVFFLDEVHRSYNPKGSFLANLELADKHSIKIGLTGTPLLGKEYNSKTLFGDYIHKYYYNLSIKDGYTLRLIREEIESNYKLVLQEALDKINVLKGDLKRSDVYADARFVEPMLDYIVKDLEQARIAMNDNTIGGMVVCDSSDQAKMMQEIFDEVYAEKQDNLMIAAESRGSYITKYKSDSKVKTAQVILHDIGTKQDRKDWVAEFKAGNLDFIFVYNMLLTGFDAKRLKKLYIGRKIKAHNLLQTLTRVNRTYKNHRYGYVVDFADIQKEFDKTNRDYFRELQNELGDEMEHYSNLFKSADEITDEIEEIKDVLFKYDTENATVFSDQISEINDREEIREIVKVLNNAKELYNLIRLSGNFELLEQLDFRKLSMLSRLANDRLALINTKIALENDVDTQNFLNTALEDVIFAFTKVKEEEMVLADELKDTLQKTREMLGGNFDPRDPEFISLKEELERLFKKKNLNEVTKEEMEANIKALNKIYDEAKKLERENQLLKAKYNYDAKYARIHKRLMEKDPLTEKERKLFDALNGLKNAVDAEIEQNSKILENESYVEKMVMRLIINQFKKEQKMDIDATTVKRINGIVVREYMNEYNGRVA